MKTTRKVAPDGGWGWVATFGVSLVNVSTKVMFFLTTPLPPVTRAHLEDLNKFRHPPALLPPTPIVSFPLNQLRESATWYPLTPLYRFACRPVRCLSSLRNRSAGSSDILNNSFRFRRLSRVGDNKMEILFCNSSRRRQALHGDNRLRVSDELEESV